MSSISDIIDQIIKKTIKPEEGIIKAINEPGLFSFNELIYSPCLNSVADTSAHKTMLKHFAYHTFSQCKDEIMKHKEIVKPEGIYKMKLLSIATLASKSRKINFQEVMKELCCSENEAESLLTDAIGDNYVRGTISGKDKTITIEDFVARDVEIKDINILIKRLDLWSGKVEKAYNEFNSVAH